MYGRPEDEDDNNDGDNYDDPSLGGAAGSGSEGLQKKKFTIIGNLNIFPKKKDDDQAAMERRQRKRRRRIPLVEEQMQREQRKKLIREYYKYARINFFPRSLVLFFYFGLITCLHWAGSFFCLPPPLPLSPLSIYPSHCLFTALSLLLFAVLLVYSPRHRLS